jgi:broad specificity phosphatase PhoE
MLLLLLLGAALGGAEADEAQLWQALRSGEAAALLRHAPAPGTGDPAGFALDDCSTQRNLSAEGRALAKDIGARFRRHGIAAARVLSSRWCRCLDTAELLGLGAVTPFDGLGSFYNDRGTEPERTAATRALIAASTGPGKPPLVLVTHQVNITALTGIFPNSGSIVVVRPVSGADGAGLEMLGRMEP